MIICIYKYIYQYDYILNDDFWMWRLKEIEKGWWNGGLIESMCVDHMVEE